MRIKPEKWLLRYPGTGLDMDAFGHHMVARRIQAFLCEGTMWGNGGLQGDLEFPYCMHAIPPGQYICI